MIYLALILTKSASAGAVPFLGGAKSSGRIGHIDFVIAVLSSRVMSKSLFFLAT